MKYVIEPKTKEQLEIYVYFLKTFGDRELEIHISQMKIFLEDGTYKHRPNDGHVLEELIQEQTRRKVEKRKEKIREILK